MSFVLQQWVAVVLSTACIFASPLQAQTNPPREWIDADTGHRVVQLSTEPGSESLNFNLNPVTPDGQKTVITSPDGISLVNLQTHEVEQIIGDRARIIMVGRKTGRIYCVNSKIEKGVTNQGICALDPKTKAVREILKLARGQQVSTVNADETLLGGTITERSDWGTNGNYFDGGDNKMVSHANHGKWI